MRIHEYRVVLPCTVDEYHLAQLYMVAKASREETGKQVGEGIEVVKNEPYETNKFNMPPGQYTEKIFYLKSKIPKWIAVLMPESFLTLYEYSWNAYPKCMTVYENKFLGEKFYMCVETMHLPDRGETENANNLSNEELKERKVELLDVSEPLDVTFESGYNPTNFESKKTGRGPFKPGYYKKADPVMCCYKIVRLKFKTLGQSKIEKWGQYYGMRNPFISFHRKLVCWMDEWAGLKLEDIREYEDETARIVREKLAEKGPAMNGKKATVPSKNVAVNPM
mmetsp:Transcript_11971/g.36464  ORF Transcript_11971/g.36464 Transcript_11971/m.36464 type:complete len:279 (-) Transcript_11971:322-1158(-)|eukprot:CAMPEP_0198736680 /NCGR_PEP_ID=MMETSP1475-20131203/67480_1 /TAXON_ID= ORGANISM="Unidentified sp., Strain CCMP1999" /NCGR_SAMPLE_ID=MMETSP1475 /ASSEMBLY_ACC=CAM_ASM_001111 /LENGTH=278 /DNA_ID=CAMNT_0044500529 /DNA_START=61 /DNA_END=897 /DNA_ORIENTATION=+